MTMVASFMPSLAFAATTHSYAVHFNEATKVATDAWSVIEDASKAAATKEYVEVVKAPTCTEAGLVKVTCQTPFCGDVVEVTVDELGHGADSTAMTVADYVNARVAQKDLASKAADATKADLAKQYCSVNAPKCSRCGYVGAMTTGTAHTEPSDLANCARKFTCTACGGSAERTTLSGGGPLSAHTEDTNTEKVVSAADCGHAAVIEGTCSVCKETYTKAGEAATGACTPKSSPITASLKTKDVSTGTEYYYDGVKVATETGGSWTAEDGYYVDTTYNEVEVYKWDTVIVDTCADGKKVAVTCKNCGKSIKEDTVRAAGHDWETKKTAATCNANAKKYDVCKTCGEYKTETGSSEYFEDAKMTDDPSVEKPAHNFVVSKVAATCGSAASYKAVCSSCNTVVVVPASSFTLNQSKWINTKTGVVGDVKGADCVELPYIENVSVAHKYTKKVTLKEATCTSAKYVGYVCDNCGKINAHGDAPYVATTEGTPIDHSYVDVVKAPTCEEAGYTVKKCSSCEKYAPATGTDPVSDITAAKHFDVKDKLSSTGKHVGEAWKVTKASTVFEEGVKTLVCPTCGDELGAKTVIAKKTVAKASNTVTAGKKKLTVKSSAANATGYRVYYKKAGAKSWKSYTKKTASLSKTFSGLSKGKYYVKVKAYAKNYAGDGQVVCGATSSTKSVKVK